jgi:flagellar hook-associated protein 2
MVFPSIGLLRIDPSEVIQRIRAQYGAERTARVGVLERLSERASSTRDAIATLEAPLTALRTTTENFRSINGGGVRLRATSTDDSIIAATASTSAASGTTEIAVSTLARRSSFSFAAPTGAFSSGAAPIAAGLDDSTGEKSRTVTFAFGEGSAAESVAIVLKSETTVDDFVSSFNSLSTRATASTVDTGTADAPNLSIVITANDTGTAAANLTVTAGSTLTDPNSDGDESDAVFASSVLTQATNATFSVSGIAGTFTRSGNSFADVIPGVALELRSTGTATVTVAPDTAGTTTRVREFVRAYNSLIGAVQTGNQSQTGDPIGTAPLRGTRVDDDLLSAVRTDVVATGEALSLAGIGITTERDGTLVLDELTLNEMLGSNADAVGVTLAALGEKLARTGGTLDQFAGTTGRLSRAANEQTARVKGYTDRVERLDRLLTARYAALESSAVKLQATLPRLESQSAILQSLIRP